MSQAGLARITTQVLPPGLIQTINGDTGSITGSTITIYAHNSANQSGATVQFVNSGTVSTLKLSDSDATLCLGQSAGNSAGPGNTGQGCTFIGVGCGNSSGIGSYENMGIGYGSLTLMTSGNNNTGAGTGTLTSLLTGSFNTTLGSQAGQNYVGAESNNILIANFGVLGESNVLRIGSQGSGTNEVNKAFIAGISGVTAVGSPVAVSNTGQLSDLGFGTATQVLTSNGAGVSPTWQAAGGGFLDAFSAYKSAPTNNATGDGTTFTVVCNTALTSSPNYNTATGVYTAPATGIYLFTKTICFNGSDASVTQYITYWNGSAFGVRSYQSEVGAQGTYIFSDCIIIPMTAGDTMGIQALASGGSKDIQIYGATPTSGATTTLFSGQRIK